EFLLKLQESGSSSSSSSPARHSPSTGDGGSSVVSVVQSQFESALDDDLNISGALGALFEFIREANRRRLSADEAAAVLAVWRRLDAVLGLGIPTPSAVPATVLALVAERQAARQARNFKRSDEIRDELKAQGWVIEDT